MKDSAGWRTFQPWAGLIAAVLAAGIAHQFGSEGMFDDCQRIGPGPLQIVAILCMTCALAGGWFSLPILRAEGEGGARRVIAIISVGMAALAFFSIILPLIASLTLPPCFQ
jgi:hypothetical protein